MITYTLYKKKRYDNNYFEICIYKEKVYIGNINFFLTFNEFFNIMEIRKLNLLDSYEEYSAQLLNNAEHIANINYDIEKSVILINKLSDDNIKFYKSNGYKTKNNYLYKYLKNK